MNGTQLKAMPLYEKRMIVILMSIRLAVIKGMVRYDITEKDIAKRTGMTEKTIKDIIQVNKNLSLSDMAKLEVCMGDLARESVKDQVVMVTKTGQDENQS